MFVAWSTLAQLLIFVCSRFSVMLFGSPGISSCHATIAFVKSSSFGYFKVLKRDFLFTVMVH